MPPKEIRDFRINGGHEMSFIKAFIMIGYLLGLFPLVTDFTVLNDVQQLDLFENWENLVFAPPLL